MERLTRDDNYNLAVGVSRMHVMFSPLFRNHEIVCFDRTENIANYTISLAIRNNFEMMSTTNKIIRGILEGGLNVKWQREHEVNIPPEIDEKRQARANSMEEFMILIYFVCIPGLFLATATLMLERTIAVRKLRAQTARERKFWMQLEKMVDGRRHMFRFRFRLKRK